MAHRTGRALIEQMNSFMPGTGSLALWWLGQMGVALKGDDGALLYIDPCLSDIVNAVTPDDFGERLFPPPLVPAEVDNAAAVLCTHEHIDHTDPDTLPAIAAASPAAPIYVTGWVRQKVVNEMGITAGRVRVPEVDSPFELGAARITPLPSAHPTVEHDAAKGHRWLGFLIEWNGVRLYHAGDTVVYDGYIERLRALGPIDIAILPVNGRDWMRDRRDVIGNLLPSEAVALGAELGWGLIIPGHNDLYKGNRIAPGHIFDEGRERAPGLTIRPLWPGELYHYVR